jgi:hypothetical protein
VTEQAPVSSRHVRIKLHNLVNIPEAIIDRLEIVTHITRNDRAETIVQRPGTVRLDEQQQWDKEMLAALRYLEGQSGGIAMSMGRTFTVEWDGICRPI